MNILFVTTGNLVTNPRLFKELAFLSEYHTCHFVGFELNNWSALYEDPLRKKLKNVSFTYIPAHRKPFIKWFISTLVERICQKIFRVFRENITITAFASNKRSFLISDALRKSDFKPDFVIAHNLGALYPVWKLGSKRNISFGFDLEDFHPEEKIKHDGRNEKYRRRFLLKSILPDAFYISFSSPLIGEALNSLVGKDRIKRSFLIHNGFASHEFPASKVNQGKLRFVWFSQNVNYGRGLENLLHWLDKLSYPFEVHVYGDINTAFLEKEIRSRNYVVLHAPLIQTELHRELSGYDIGLALESADEDMNRDICLTNKMFAFAQAGLYILATNTKAQSRFIQENKEFGIVIELTENKLLEGIQDILNNLAIIRENSLHRLESARKFSWEILGANLSHMLDELNDNATRSHG